MSSASEKEAGIKALGMDDLPLDFASSMVENTVIQLRSYSVGFRIDQWIRSHYPGLKVQQEHSIRSQLAENAQVLSPEIRQRFPKALLDANTVMNAAYALAWGTALAEPQFAIPFKALGYAKKAKELLEILEELPDDPRSDREIIARWADSLGLEGCFHFTTHTLT